MAKIGALKMGNERSDGYITYKINKNELRKYVQKIKEFANTEIKNLNENESKILTYITTSIEKLHESPDAYNEFINYVNNTFSDIKTFSPNTVAAFFLGCIENDIEDCVPAGCNPSCLNSVNNLKNSLPKCESNVLNFNGGKMENLNISNSSLAYIYFNNKDEIKITKKQINDMQKNGIKQVRIYKLGENGKTSILSSIIDIEKVYSEIDKIKKDIYSTMDNNNTSQQSYILIIAFLILAIIIILIIILSR